MKITSTFDKTYKTILEQYGEPEGTRYNNTMFNNLIEKVKIWGKKDWDNMVNEYGKFEVMNNAGGVDYELSWDEYFGTLEKVRDFSGLESWWLSIMGMDGDGGFASWLDEIMEIK